jgi:signal transduction histidine kinase
MTVEGGAAQHVTTPSFYIVKVFSLLAFFSLFTFGSLQIFAEHNAQLGYLEIIGSMLIALNYIAASATKNIRLARNVLLLIMVAFLVVMLVTGGTQGTGAFWLFVFPVSAFFLAGKRGGAYWMGCLFAVTILMVVASGSGWFSIAYSVVEIRQLLLCLLVVAVGTFAYQHAREEAEKQVRREQRLADEAKNEFLTLASHQLRTPISAISWFTEMLLQGDAGKLTETQKEYIDQVHESNKRSATIVDAIIMVSNLQGTQIAQRPKMVNLEALGSSIVQEQLKAQPTVRKIDVREQYSAKVKKVRIDPKLTETIIRNLVSNAIKYTPDGGRVEISAGIADTEYGLKSKGQLFIRVVDTGYGVPKNQHSKIFAKLFRASNIKSKDTDGTGLGLFIVKAILEQVGGRIQFTSVENEGSTFIALLPVENEQHKGEKNA